MRIDDRLPMHQTVAGPPLSTSAGVPMNQHMHRMGGIPQQSQQQQYQQRIPRTGGPMQRGKVTLNQLSMIFYNKTCFTFYTGEPLYN